MNTPRNPNNNPAINADDPKWTAYVLGEVDEAERLEIEQLLKTSEEARALIEELTLATETLKEELTPSTGFLMMSPEQRATIRSAAEPKPRRWLEMFPSKWGMGLAAAAVIVLVAVLPMAWRNDGGSVLRDLEVREGTVPLTGPVALGARTEQEEAKADEGKSAAAQVASAKDAAPAKLADAKETPASKKEADSSRQVPATGAVAAPVVTLQQFAELAQGAPAAALSNVTVLAGNGSLSGTVQDASKAFIPGVTITAVNIGTGATATTITNESGAYTFRLAPGTYNVRASLPGFQARTVTGVQLQENAFARLDFPMQVASVSSMVQVTVDSSSIVTQSAASVGEVLPEQRLQNLRVRAEGAAPPPSPPPPPVNTVRDGISMQGQQGQGQGQGQGQQGAAGGGGGGGGGGRAGGAAAAPQRPTTINPDQVSEMRVVVSGLSAAQLASRSNAELQKAAAPPPAPPALGRPLDRVDVIAPNTEAYDRITDNPFIRTTQENLATFSIDVDTASYANVRRFLNQNQLPPRDAVRIEELVNYFSYDYAQPSGNVPIAPNMEVAAAPWNPSARLVRIGIKAREVNANRRPPSNLVFLIDVSGSMNSPEKLPLVKAGLNMLAEQLGENDMVSMVVYAGNSGLVLPPTSGMRKETIRQAIDRLQAGGSTNGGAGIQLAYNQATVNFLRNGSNRVILMTDGDFNVGVTNQGDLTRLIQERARSGVFLSVLGFGMGNIKDSTLEKLADQGNGNYAYIDNLAEARKVLVEEMSGTLVTVAKDVKIQVDFNPAKVEAYRLIGYENRVLQTQDFNNDAKDAGDMGAGHTVTALFEVVPKGGAVPGPSVDPSKYTQPAAAAAAADRNVGSSSNEMLTLRVRYKEPNADTSKRMDVPLVDRGTAFNRASSDFRFAASVAEFGMILRDSPFRGNSKMESVLDIAQGNRGVDRNGYRAEFITLVQKARNLGR